MVGVFGAEMAVSFRSSGVGPKAGIFGQFWAAQALFYVLDRNVHVNLLELDGLNCVENDMLMHSKMMC